MFNLTLYLYTLCNAYIESITYDQGEPFERESYVYIILRTQFEEYFVYYLFIIMKTNIGHRKKKKRKKSKVTNQFVNLN